jgi:hypothetical protein
VRNTETSASIWVQIRDTVDFEIPDSQPSALTRSSTLRVEVPVMYAVMITAHRALSIRRRGSSNSGKNEPRRSLGIPISTSPPGVEISFGRCPLRCVTRSLVRSPGPAPIVAVSSASINSCNATVRMSRSDVDKLASVPSRRTARSDKANSWVVIVRPSGRLGRFRESHDDHHHPDDGRRLLHHVMGLTRWKKSPVVSWSVVSRGGAGRRSR